MSIARYHQQIAGARDVALALTVAQQQEFLELLFEYANEMAARVSVGLSSATVDQTLAELDFIIQRMARDLALSTGENVRLTAQRVADIQAEATAALIASSSSSISASVSFSGAATRAAQAILARRELAEAFATIRDETSSAANRILRRGLLRGAPSTAIARELRQYVVADGSLLEGDASILADRRRIGYGTLIELGYEPTPENLEMIRKEAAQIASKAQRIARTEIMQTEREVSIQAAIDSPVVAYIKIRLSYRHKAKCACEPIVEADWFGLGEGVYPVRQVPSRPHPNCWCPHSNILLPESEWGKPRPADPERVLDPDDVAARFNLSPSQTRSMKGALYARDPNADLSAGDAPQRGGSPAPEPPAVRLRTPEERRAEAQALLATNLRDAEAKLQNDRVEHGYMFDPATGKLDLHYSAGLVGQVPIWEFQKKGMVGKIFTHNHPTQGGSFSVDDILVASEQALLEVRAVDGARKQYVYSMRAGEGGWPDSTEIKIAYRDAKREAMIRMLEAVRAGLISPTNGEYELLHRTWDFVAQILGVEYRRIRWEEWSL